MVNKGYWKTLDAAPKHIRDGLSADYRLIDAIEKDLGKGHSPFDDPEVIELMDSAIKTWNNPSIGMDRPTYLKNFYVIYPYVLDGLVQAGYSSDIEVAVEPDSSNNSPETAVDFSGDSQTS